MTEREHDEPTRETGRRSFLRRSGAALFGVGLGARRIGDAHRQDGGSDGGQGGDGEPGGLPNVYMVLPDAGPLGRDFFRDVVLLTEPTDVRPEPDELRGCGDFRPPGRLDGYQGLVVDQAEVAQVFEGGDLSNVGPTREVNVFVSADEADDVRVGSPYIITDGNYCEGDYVAVTTHRLPHPLRGGTGSDDGFVL